MASAECEETLSYSRVPLGLSMRVIVRVFIPYFLDQSKSW